jgi:hypothetical protein
MGTIVLASALLFAFLLVLQWKSPSQAARLEPIANSSGISHDILPTSGAYHGAVVRGLPAQPDQPAPLVDMFEIIAGKRLSVIKVYQHFFNEHFYDNWADFIHGRCAIEFLSFDPTIPETVDLNCCEVLSGDYDSIIITFAQEIKNWGKPLMLSFAGEMNGNWAGWSGAKNFGPDCDQTYTETADFCGYYGCDDCNRIECYDGPERYRDMYRHVHDIFATQGVNNVTWVWVVNHESFPNESDQPWNHADNYYPGDEYIDVISVDGYNWGNDGPGGCPVDVEWKTFDEVFSAMLASLSSIHPTKPFIVGEFASAEGTGSWSKANWITDAYDSIKSDWPQIKAMVWFNLSYDCQFQVESSLESMWAYRQAIADPYFVGGRCTYLPVILKNY